MDDCVFCKIISYELSSNIIEETEDYIAIYDILPQAPVHFLVVSKEHINSAHHLEEHHKPLIGNMIIGANKIADQKGIGETGYKMIFNVGKEGGQIIPHLHMHVLGGKQMSDSVS